MTTTRTVTEAQARAALEAVRRQFRSYLEPLTIPATADEPALTLSPQCPEPTINMDWDGGVAIVWEDGPDDWAHRATLGGTSEEERVLAHQAAVEFGADPARLAPKPDSPVRWPKGIEAEPYSSFVLCLYTD